MMAEWGILASLGRPVTQPINLFACTADGILTVSTNETSMRGLSDLTIHSYIPYHYLPSSLDGSETHDNIRASDHNFPYQTIQHQGFYRPQSI